MNISMMVAAAALVACLCATEGAAETRLVRKQQRPTRGFKNVEMMTARGFGKRDHPPARAQRDVENQAAPSQRSLRGTPIFKSPSVGIARDFGKRVPEEMEESESRRPKFNPKTSLLIASDFGKRSLNDFNEDNVEEEEEQTRTRRGNFKPNSKVLTARGFGKRQDRSESDGVYGLDNFWEMLENSPEREGLEQNEDKTFESIPIDWFVTEMLNNPQFARTAVRKFIDLNQDGMLSSEELLRNVV